MNRKYSDIHIEWIRNNIRGCHFKELTIRFNKTFKTELSVAAMISLSARHGLHNDIDARFNTGYEPTQFKKGNIPYNKGKKGVGGWEPTQFKKGNKPANWVPIGTERINRDGYVEVKIQDGKLQKNWRGKHIVIWEAKNGSLPKGHVVIFGDGNNRNFDINNLILVSRKQLLILNQKNLIQNDADLTRTAVIIADLHSKIYARNKSKKPN